MQDGEPQTGSVRLNEVAYYVAYVNVAKGDEYSVQLVPTSGDSDIFVLVDAPPGVHASAANYTFVSQSYGGEDVVHVGPFSHPYKTKTRLGITVRGYTASEYTILYSSSNVLSRLLDGVAQFGTVSQNEYRYYRIAVDHTGDALTVSTSDFSGDVELYVAVQEAGGKSTWPTRQNFTWASQAFGDDIVTVANAISYCPDELQQTGCNFIIGVFGWQDSTYAITATTSATVVTRLADGVPTHGTAKVNEYRYF